MTSYEALRLIATNRPGGHLSWASWGDFWMAPNEDRPTNTLPWVVFALEVDEPPFAEVEDAADAEFIATFDRPTVLALLDDIAPIVASSVLTEQKRICQIISTAGLDDVTAQEIIDRIMLIDQTAPIEEHPDELAAPRLEW